VNDDQHPAQCPCECHCAPFDQRRRDLLKALGLAALDGILGASPVFAHASGICPCGEPEPGVTPVACERPPFKTHDGSVYVPNKATPPKISGAQQSIWMGNGRPPKGDPAEAKWFQQQIANLSKNAPTFGPRKDEFLPNLLVRASTGDRGARPIDPFWESPDVLLLPNQQAATAPAFPSNPSVTATAGQPHTIYAHVWNLGKAPVYRARVEFYWVNPSLGISQADANFIGATWVDLANRFTLYPTWTTVTESYGTWASQGCHAIVKCPVTWTPVYQDSGHECLVVRVFDPILDAISPLQFSAGDDRHVGQHNISVAQAHSPATVDFDLELGYPTEETTAELSVEMLGPASMNWLQLYAWQRNYQFKRTSSPVTAGFTAPYPAVQGQPILQKHYLPKIMFKQTCTPLKVHFHASANNLMPNDAQVLRVRHTVSGKTVGGYTVVLLKPEGKK
jgi:hypothetical protein